MPLGHLTVNRNNLVPAMRGDVAPEQDHIAQEPDNITGDMLDKLQSWLDSRSQAREPSATQKVFAIHDNVTHLLGHVAAEDFINLANAFGFVLRIAKETSALRARFCLNPKQDKLIKPTINPALGACFEKMGLSPTSCEIKMHYGEWTVQVKCKRVRILGTETLIRSPPPDDMKLASHPIQYELKVTGISDEFWIDPEWPRWVGSARQSDLKKVFKCIKSIERGEGPHVPGCRGELSSTGMHGKALRTQAVNMC